MKRPAELDDKDRKPEFTQALDRANSFVTQAEMDGYIRFRPMGHSHRIPSPYTTPEVKQEIARLHRREHGAAIAGMCFLLIAACIGIVGVLTMWGWLAEAVR